MKHIQIKRIYEPLDAKDGFRILVDGLWPRGMKKENAEIDSWLKSVAPSPALRKWFAHDPAKWKLFQKKYMEELKSNAASGELLAFIKNHKRITLLYAAKDEQHNHAVVLKQWIGKDLL